MKLKIIFLLIVKVAIIYCDLDLSVDPIDTEYYRNVLYNRTIKQEIAHVMDERTDGRIVGGSPAVLGQFDYYVIVYGENRRYLCGGTLIKVNWVLTAGHCLYDISNVEVHFGIVNRLQAAERIIKVEDNNHLIIHEEFDSSELFNDIGLIYLEKMSTTWLESSSIGLVEPKFYDFDITNRNSSICGFGKTSDASGASYTLNYINIPIMEYNKCRKYYYLDENNICVSTESGESPCNGDSGGGVVVTTEDNQRYIVGIVSFGATLCEIRYPVVLTKVNNYLEWMKEKFESISSSTTLDTPITTSTSPTFEEDPTEDELITTTTVSTKDATSPSSVDNVFVKRKLIFMIITILILFGIRF